ncbi:helix-turn-helix domain-containing protein [Bosea sp. TWI1241]|uniref:helix-turn-helix domain-containing protein n=1 Tax=Bosea sp. TWI1241 TaxID=3148904 RepID=UPI00320815F8
MSREPETQGSPRKRIAEMTALALATCGVAPERLAMVEPDPGVLQVRRLAAWLMRRRAGLGSADIAAALGVDPAFVNQTLFLARIGIAARGLRINGPIAEVAASLARVFAAREGEPGHVDAASLAEVREAVLKAFGLSLASFTGEGRGAREARARQSFAWLAEQLTPAAPKEIGRWMNRERTTVSAGLARVDRIGGVADLRRQILARLAEGRPDRAMLDDFATALERLGAPQPR